MKKIFTVEFMQLNCGCYKPDKLASCSFMKQETITLESIIKSEIPLKDKFWFICKKVVSKEQNQQIAISVAEIVLPIYEKRYLNDIRVRECIEAAKQFIAGHISIEELNKKRRAAAYAADAAAAYVDAAYAADAAAAAAAYVDAAYAAYVDAAYAADAAAAAADAADAAVATATNISQQLLDFLIDFCNKSTETLI
jgi:hypothetical protein